MGSDDIWNVNAPKGETRDFGFEPSYDRPVDPYAAPHYPAPHYAAPHHGMPHNAMPLAASAVEQAPLSQSNATPEPTPWALGAEPDLSDLDRFAARYAAGFGATAAAPGSSNRSEAPAPVFQPAEPAFAPSSHARTDATPESGVNSPADASFDAIEARLKELAAQAKSRMRPSQAAPAKSKADPAPMTDPAPMAEAPQAAPDMFAAAVPATSPVPEFTAHDHLPAFEYRAPDTFDAPAATSHDAPGETEHTSEEPHGWSGNWDHDGGNTPSSAFDAEFGASRPEEPATFQDTSSNQPFETPLAEPDPIAPRQTGGHGFASPDFTAFATAEAGYAAHDEASFDAAFAAPETDFDMLASRMDDLARKFDAALNSGATDSHVSAIETQLAGVSELIERVKAHDARVSAIETRMGHLIEAVESSGSHMDEIASRAATQVLQQSQAQADERLTLIHGQLKTLEERASRSTGQMADSLAAVQNSLSLLVQKFEQAPAPIAPPVQASVQAPWHRSRTPAPQPQTPPAAPKAAAQPQTPPVQPDAPTQGRRAYRDRDLGASIPDFMPGAPPRAEAGPRQTSHVLSQARQALAAQDRQPEKPVTSLQDLDLGDLDDLTPPRKALFSGVPSLLARATAPFDSLKTRLRGSAAPKALDHAGAQPGSRSRPVLIAAATALLLASAFLFYLQLKDKFANAPVPATQQTGQPTQLQQPLEPVKPSRDSVITPEQAQPDDADHRSAALVPETPVPAQKVTARLVHGPDDAAAPTEANVLERPDGAFGGLTATALGNELDGADVTIEQGHVISADDGTDPATAAHDAKYEAPHSSEAYQARSAKARHGLPLPPANVGPYSLRYAASKGNPSAMYIVGKRYAEGKGIEKDLHDAARWFAQAAARGFAPAQYRLAAQYERGLGIKKDIERARVWYQRAAQGGNVKAMHNLAVIHTGRDGNTPHYGAAAHWFTQAANFGLPDSQFNLGVLNESGLGLTKNMAEAYKWYSLAALHGDKEAAKRRDAVRTQLTQAQLMDTERTIANWRPVSENRQANEVRPPQEGWTVATAPATPGEVTLVARVQTLLDKLGLDAGTADGMMGPKTVDAIKTFQRQNGMAETGKVSPDLVEKLERLAT